MKKLCALTALLATALVGNAGAALVNVDIGTGPLFIGTGVAGGGTWNAMNHGGQSGPLVDSNGASSNITFSVNSIDNFVDTTGGTNPANNPATSALLEDYGATAFNNSISMTISGLVPLATYDLTIYAAGSTTGEADVFNANFPGTTTASSRGIFVSGDNYLRHLVTADANGMFSTGAGGLNGNDAVFNGFQILTVPEPSTWALLTGGVLGLLTWRRLAPKSARNVWAPAGNASGRQVA